MNDSKNRTEPKTPGRDGELRVVAINYNPAPDAEDRLRRLFTMLLEHAARERQAVPEDETSADATPADDRTQTKA